MFTQWFLDNWNLVLGRARERVMKIAALEHGRPDELEFNGFGEIAGGTHIEALIADTGGPAGDGLVSLVIAINLFQMNDEEFAAFIAAEEMRNSFAEDEPEENFI